MGKYNYTNRAELFWDIDDDERDIFVAVSTLEKEFYVVLNMNRISKKILKNHKNINEATSKIFCEIYRGAFRKEIELGTLSDPIYDNLNQGQFSLDDRINRSLADIDPNRVNFRLIITNNQKKILASSNSIKPFFIGKKEEIKKIKINKELPLFATKVSDEIYHPWDIGFENDHDKSKMIPVIYFNSSLDLASECETDDRLSIIIFSFAFKELLRRCLILDDVEDNKYIQGFLEFAENANNGVKTVEIQQKLSDTNESEIIFSEEIESFINKSLEVYLDQLQLLKKYNQARQNILTED